MNAERDTPGEFRDDVAMAFELAPVGLLVSRQRVIQTCNRTLCDMFGYTAEELSGQSLERLYPSIDEFQHTGEHALPQLRDTGCYADERIMRHSSGRLFWCHVSGRASDRADPFAAAVWMFEDISAKRPVTAEFTVREREVARFLVSGKQSQEIARTLGISPRTVEAHRARLMHKLKVATPAEMIARLVGQG